MSCRLSAIHSYVATVNSIFQCRKNKINGAFLFGMLKRTGAMQTGPYIHLTLPVNNPK